MASLVNELMYEKDLKKVNELLETKRGCKNEVFRICSKKGYLELMKIMVSLGADIHTWNENALINACHFGYLEMVMYLYEAGSNIHVEDNS